MAPLSGAVDNGAMPAPDFERLTIAANGLRFHALAAGPADGPLLVLLHGFPETSHGWNREIAPLAAAGFRVVAPDQRGIGLSSKPAGAAAYRIDLLAADIVAIVRALGRERAQVAGHDWGGVVAWQVAIDRPDLVDRLVILNLPHLRGLRRELATNPQQQKNSAYARFFQQDDAWKQLTVAKLVDTAVPDKADAETREKYTQAMQRSSIEAMLAYYRQNYPREPYAADTSPVVKVHAPVLMIHGLDDPFLLPGALDGTWQWVDNTLTIVTLPHVGHFVLRDAPDRVVPLVADWLAHRG